MPMTPAWRVDHDAPFEDFCAWLISQPERNEEQAECLAFINLLEKRGGILDGDKYLTHTNGLREFQGQFVRILYECYPDSREVCLKDGFLAERSG